MRSVWYSEPRLRPQVKLSGVALLQGKVKQIVGSTLKDLDPSGGTAELQTNFESGLTSSFYANLYRLNELPGGHVIMLGADFASRCAAFEALQSYPGGLQLGGGVTDLNAASYIDAGASHVIVTSHVFNAGRLDETRLQELVQLIGKDRLVLDLSCRWRDGSYWIVTDRWQCFTEVCIDASTLDKLAASCAEFLVHGVDVEGKQLGIDEQLVSLLGRHSPIPVTYAGGVASLEDLALVEAAGAGRVDCTVGSALDIFGGRLAFDDVVRWHRRE